MIRNFTIGILCGTSGVGLWAISKYYLLAPNPRPMPNGHGFGDLEVLPPRAEPVAVRHRPRMGTPGGAGVGLHARHRGPRLVGFELPEVGLLYNAPEEIEAAKAYVTRRAPDLLQMLGLEEAPPVRIEEPGVTHCSKGHEFTEANTIWRKDARGNYSRRRCRQCKNDYAKAAPRPSRAKKGKPQ